MSDRDDFLRFVQLLEAGQKVPLPTGSPDPTPTAPVRLPRPTPPGGGMMAPLDGLFGGATGPESEVREFQIGSDAASSQVLLDFIRRNLS